MRRGRPSKNPSTDEATDQHIIMQLRKVAILNGQKKVEFRNGDTSYVHPDVAVKLIAQYNAMDRPSAKAEFQDFISFSLEQFSQYAER